jgi:glycosyltransferase involved in cell wall biosynthesis
MDIKENQSLNTPKVSVVIPNYNHARYLKKRLQSVLEQTYQDLEIIYLDDASTDNSNEVFLEFSNDPRIRSLLNEKNSGSPFKQWNKGIKNAKGEYIWIAESDDYANATLLEKLVDALNKNPAAGLAYCQSWEVDENDQVLSNYQWLTDELDTERWKTNYTNSGIDEFINYMIFRNTIPNASAVVFRRSIYEEVGGAPENFRLCGDWLFWSKFLMQSGIVFIAEPLNYFRVANPKGARGSAGKGGLFWEEKLRVIQQLNQTFKLPQDVMIKALHRLTYFWIDYSLTTSVSFTRQATIYQIAKSLDSWIDITLMAQLLIILSKLISKKLGFTQYIKQLNHQRKAA